MPPVVVTAGLIGKIPLKADYVERGIALAFGRPWSSWVDGVVAEAGRLYGPDWRRIFPIGPTWRFALPKGLLGPVAWSGVLTPSSDSVGRPYPLTLVVGHGPFEPAGPEPGGGDDLFDALERIGLALVDAVLDADEAAAELAARCGRPATPSPALVPTHRRIAPPDQALWLERPAVSAGEGATPATSVLFWHGAWGGVPATRLAAAGLPPPQVFAELFDFAGRGAGWQRL